MQKSGALRILIPCAILDLISFAILLPILPLYAERLGADKWGLMFVMGSYSAVQFLAAPWLGRLSDRIGRKPVLLACYAGSAVSCLVLAGANTIPLMVLSRIITGVTGANLPIAQAIVADVMPPERRTRGMGLIGMSLGIGFIIGPASGGIVYKSFGPAGPPLLAAALSVVSILLAAWLLPETRPAGADREETAPRGLKRLDPSLLREALSYPIVAPVLVVGLLSGIAFSTFEATFSQFLARHFSFGPGDVGPVFALIGIVVAVVQGGLIGPLARSFGEEKLVATGTFCLVVALAAIPEVRNLAWLFAPLVLFAFGSGILNPSMTSLVSSSSPPGRIGAMLGVFQSMSSLGRIVGPVWGQYARGTFGEAFPYRSASLLVSLALIVALRSVVFVRKRAPRPA